MGCEHELELMMLALDGELHPSGQAALDEHLACCADCRAEWDRLQALERLLQKATTVRPPAGFAGRLLSRLDKRRRASRLLLGGLALTAGLAVAAALTLLPSLWVLPGLGGSQVALSHAGILLVVRLADTVDAMLKALWLTGQALALPAAPLTLCGLLMTLVTGLLWVVLVRRLQPANVNLVVGR